MVQPKSRPAPARPKPTITATAHLLKPWFWLFPFLTSCTPLLNCFEFSGLHGNPGRRVDIFWLSLILSWRRRFSSCNSCSHCLYANKCDACLKNSLIMCSLSVYACWAAFSASLARVWEWRSASNSWALLALFSAEGLPSVESLMVVL